MLISNLEILQRMAGDGCFLPVERMADGSTWERVTVPSCFAPARPLDTVAEIQRRNTARRTRLARLEPPKVLPVRYVGDVLPFNTRLDRPDGRILFKPGCFDHALAEIDAGWHHVGACFSHRRQFVFAETSDKTLRLSADDKGLHFSVTPHNTPFGRFIVQHALSDKLRGVSAGYTPVKTRERRDWDGQPLTVIERAKLNEISFVTHAAFGERTGFGSLSFVNPAELYSMTFV